MPRFEFCSDRGSRAKGSEGVKNLKMGVWGQAINRQKRLRRRLLLQSL